MFRRAQQILPGGIGVPMNRKGEVKAFKLKPGCSVIPARLFSL